MEGMRIMDVLRRIKGGARVMVTASSRAVGGYTYSLDDGTEVSREQVAAIRDFLVEDDAALIPGAAAQSLRWAG